MHAAKRHSCDVCREGRQPKTRRPASLPLPTDAGDQANIDLINVYDSSGTKYTAVHVIDYATRFQLAELLPRKTAANVISFLKKRWLPVFWKSQDALADQGREFISHELAEFCAGHSILLWHCGVGSPWQNGICERAGGTLRVILKYLFVWSMLTKFKALRNWKKLVDKLLELTIQISMSLACVPVRRLADSLA